MTHSLTVTLGFLCLLACGTPPQAPGARTSLEPAFARAAAELSVPVELLKGIAWVETRASTRAGLVSAAHGHGLMGLVERDGWKMLSRASALTGASEGQLDVDAEANVRGAAAVLRELFDSSSRGDPSLDPNRLGDWYQAVSLYGGFDSHARASDWAAEVFSRLEQGFELPQLALRPTASQWRQRAPTTAAERDALNGTDYPGAARYLQSPHHSSSRSSYEFVVIHTTQGSYGGAISWFQNPSSQVSANYVVRSSDGQITQMVRDADAAWHAQCYNRRSVGIEHEGFVQAPAAWYTEDMYRESAKLTRWLCDRYGIPRDRTHVVGHAEVAPQCNTSGHTDPGGGWNWVHYMDLVNNGAPTGATGVLTGAIYQRGDANDRVSGATVTVNGQSQTTAANGLYQFTLPPGTYTVSAALAGYSGSSVTRTVTAFATVWGSMEINGGASSGTLRGVVYAFDASSPSDLSQRLSGATVTVSPTFAAVTTPADGSWRFDLPPGTYTVSATRPGYQASQQTRMVVAGQTAWGSVGLSQSSAADRQPPQLAIAFPQAGAWLDLAVVDLRGTASDDRGPVASVKLALNGGAQTEVPVVGGAFLAQVKLRPGPNAIEVSAADAAGNPARATSTATFNAGLEGFVHARGDEAARVAGARLELFEPASGASAAWAVADAAGSYALSPGLVPADYKLLVRAAGFRTHVETVTVSDEQRLRLDVALTPGVDGAGELSVTFTEPREGATIATDAVTVYGAASGFEVLAVAVNGTAGEVLGGGGFSATVPLVEGDNVLTAVVTGTSGEKVSGTLRVTHLRPGPGPKGEQKARGCSSGGGPALALALLALARAALVNPERLPGLGFKRAPGPGGGGACARGPRLHSGPEGEVSSVVRCGRRSRAAAGSECEPGPAAARRRDAARPRRLPRRRRGV